MKTNLLQGKRYIYSNDNFCVRTQSDDIRCAEVFYSNNVTFPGFKIFFNGALIHSSKTFASMNKRLNTLIDKWHLDFDYNE